MADTVDITIYINDPFWSKENQNRLEESRKAAEAGLLTEHELIEVV